MCNDLQTAIRIHRLRRLYAGHNTALEFFHLPFDRQVWVVRLSPIKGGMPSEVVGPMPCGDLLTVLEDAAPALDAPPPPGPFLVSLN